VFYRNLHAKEFTHHITSLLNLIFEKVLIIIFEFGIIVFEKIIIEKNLWSGLDKMVRSLNLAPIWRQVHFLGIPLFGIRGITPDILLAP